MIKPIGIIFIAATLAVAFFTATMVSRYLKKPATSEVRIVVAAADISSGDCLTLEKIKTVKCPKSDISMGCFNSAKKVVGRVAASSIYEGESINEKRLVPQGELMSSDLAGRIDPGMRAISMEIDYVSGVSRMLKPGDWVDVIASNPLQSSNGGRISRVILSMVKVLAVSYKQNAGGKVFKKKRARKEIITLLLSLEDAMVLAVSESANLKLVVMDPSDKSSGDKEPTVFSATLGPKKSSELRAMAREKDKAFNNQIENGKRAVTFTFGDDDGICGFLRPGNRVDIIATCTKGNVNVQGYKPGDEAKYLKTNMISMLILQNIKVIAVNQEAEKEDAEEDAEEKKLKHLSKGFEQIKTALKNLKDKENSFDKKQSSTSARSQDSEKNGENVKDEKKAGTVAFLLTPEEAEKLLVASKTYHIKIIARNYGDDNIVETKGHTIQSCFFKKKGSLNYEVEFYRGGQEGIIPFSKEKMEETNSSEDEFFQRDKYPISGEQVMRRFDL